MRSGPYAWRSADQTRSGVMGSRRRRTPGRGRDRVRDRRGPGDDGRLADALGAERAVGRGHLDEEGLEQRHVVGAGDHVVGEGAVQDVPVLVGDELLVEGPADRLRDAALQLPLAERRIERPTDVLRGGPGEQPRPARSRHRPARGRGGR